jgi:hypothetical protein
MREDLRGFYELRLLSAGCWSGSSHFCSAVANTEEALSIFEIFAITRSAEEPDANYHERGPHAE